MKYPLDILKESLREVEEAKKLCLKSENFKDYTAIEEEKAMPLRVAIQIIELAVENELKFNVIIK
jgi:hypothetical protein